MSSNLPAAHTLIPLPSHKSSKFKLQSQPKFPGDSSPAPAPLPNLSLILTSNFLCAVSIETMGRPQPQVRRRGSAWRAVGPKALETGAQSRGAVTRPASPPASKLSRGDARPGDRCGVGHAGGAWGGGGRLRWASLYL